MPAYKPVRRTQLITPFGVGAMVNFPGDESLMTAGLDAWPFAGEECPPDWLVIEERLQARLGVSHFRLPPEHRDPGPSVSHANQNIPYVRFPRWHYCHRCGDMQYLSLFETGRQRCRGPRFGEGMTCADLPERGRPYLIPVRLVTVCGMGHIEDFPFMRWVHQDKPQTPRCRLRFRAGRSSASLAGIKITCSCNAEKTLAGVFNFDMERGGALHTIGHDCSGAMPWLGYEGQPQECGQYLRVVQRGGANVYFSHVVSSIYLPLWAEQSRRAVNEVLDNPRYWHILTNGLEDGIRIDRARAETVADMLQLDANELAEAAQRKLDGAAEQEKTQTEEAYRRQEYNALISGRGGAETELLVEVRNASEYGDVVSEFFTRVCLVRKLRETRVLAGFTRLLPREDISPERVRQLRAGAFEDWLPSVTVRGEGIFLEFNWSRIQQWLEQSEAGQRASMLEASYNEKRVRRGLDPIPMGAKFVMIHTLAHMLINQLSFDCGYGSASLRERIYCDLEPGSESMQGLLIYTASGDAEGTMGGLVRQGEPDRFTETLIRSLQRAQWCSSDPVCIESSGQGTDNANLAACHGCVLISETSCEEGNRLLDRAAVVGTPDDSTLGLFSSVLTLGQEQHA